MKRMFKDKYGYWYFGWVVLGGIVGLLLFLSAVLAGVDYIQERQCRAVGIEMERDWRYGWFEGCLLRGQDGKLYPPRSLRERW